MLLVESHVRDFMLDAGVDPMIATQVAHSLNGTLSTGLADADNQIRFDGAVKAEKWPTIMNTLRTAVPSDMITIDDVPSGRGDTVQFTICVNEGPINAAQASQALDGLRDTYDEDNVDEFDTVDDEELT